MTKRIALALSLSLFLAPTTHAASATAKLTTPSLQRAFANKDYKELAGFALHHLIADGIFVYRGIEGLYATFLPESYFDHNAEKFGVMGKISDGEMKDEIDGILKEIGVDPAKVRLLAIDPDRATMLEGESSYLPALAMGSVLLIDPKFFNFLPVEERRAVIGHEAMHIKNYDLLKASLFSLAIPLITHFGVKKYQELLQGGFNAATKSFDLQNVGATSLLFLAFNWHQYLVGMAASKLMISSSIFGWYQQLREKWADIDSARSLCCAHGATKAVERFADMQRTAKELSPLLEMLIDEKAESNLASVHPALAERIRYFAELAQEQLPQE